MEIAKLEAIGKEASDSKDQQKVVKLMAAIHGSQKKIWIAMTLSKSLKRIMLQRKPQIQNAKVQPLLLLLPTKRNVEKERSQEDLVLVEV